VNPVIIGNATLYNADCREILPILTGVDAVITDPPYGTTECKWDIVIQFDVMWSLLSKSVKQNGVTALFGSEPFSSSLRISNIKNYRYDWIWDKKLPVGHLVAKKRPMSRHENISIFYEKNVTYNPQMVMRDVPRYIKKDIGQGNTVHLNHIQTKLYENSLDSRYPTTIIEESNAKRTNEHPTQKPVALMEYLVRTYSNKDESVLDFTMGSGSTGVAAVQMDRKFIGIEIDNKYFDIACKRIEDAQRQQRMF